MSPHQSVVDALATPDHPQTWASCQRVGPSIRERLFARTERTSTGCLIKQYNEHRRYATIHIAGHPVGAHRVAFYLANGTWPTVVRHTCDEPRCLEAAHLLPGTHADNTADAVAHGRWIGPRKDHCLRGHPRTAESVYATSRDCKQCARARSSERHRRLMNGKER